LNYAVAGSKCGNGRSLSDANTTTCDTYGRLYNWATAMALPSSCNSSSCSSQIGTKHQGICPIGWHIPSVEDWVGLMTAVGGYLTAGEKLKDMIEWKNCGKDSSYFYQCDDTYGFSALPGGYGYSPEGQFRNVGETGHWWFSTEEDLNSNSALYGYMHYGTEAAIVDRLSKREYLYSVRCVKN